MLCLTFVDIIQKVQVKDVDYDHPKHYTAKQELTNNIIKVRGTKKTIIKNVLTGKSISLWEKAKKNYIHTYEQKEENKSNNRRV